MKRNQIMGVWVGLALGCALASCTDSDASSEATTDPGATEAMASDDDGSDDDPEDVTDDDAVADAGEATDEVTDGETDVTGEQDAGLLEPLSCPQRLSAVPTAVADVVCRKRVECCETDYAQCLVEVNAALESIYPELDAAEAAGSAELDCDAFDTCAEAIQAADCAEWPAQVGGLGQLPVDEASCRRMVEPLLSPAEECSANYECVDGFCWSEDGQCHPFAEEDAECGDGVEQLCDLSSMFCNEAGRCQLRLENGVSCNDDAACASGVCESEASGACVAPGPDACDYVPSAPASCSTARLSSSSPTLWLWLVSLIGLVSGWRRWAGGTDGAWGRRTVSDSDGAGREA